MAPGYVSGDRLLTTPSNVHDIGSVHKKNLELA